MSKATSVAAMALASAVAWTGPSLAQDNPPPPPPADYNSGGMSMAPWGGFYIGGNLGWSGNTNDLKFRDLSADQDITFHRRDDGNSVMGGVHGGYNWWMGNILAGVEGDVDWANHVDYLASARGRLGFTPNDRWLVYGTAGVAWMGNDQSFTAFSATDNVTTKFSRGNDDTGFVGGIGTEYALNRNLGLGVEGLWYNFGDDRSNLRVSPGEDFSVRDDKSIGVVRARLTWYLNQ